MKYLNTFRSIKGKLVFEDTKHLSLIKQEGDYSPYRKPASVLYFYKNIAINEFVKFNKEHFNRLVTGQRPEGPYTSATFLYDQAMETKARGIELLKNSKGGTDEDN